MYIFKLNIIDSKTHFWSIDFQQRYQDNSMGERIETLLENNAETIEYPCAKGFI